MTLIATMTDNRFTICLGDALITSSEMSKIALPRIPRFDKSNVSDTRRVSNLRRKLVFFHEDAILLWSGKHSFAQILVNKLIKMQDELDAIDQQRFSCIVESSTNGDAFSCQFVRRSHEIIEVLYYQCEVIKLSHSQHLYIAGKGKNAFLTELDANGFQRILSGSGPIDWNVIPLLIDHRFTTLQSLYGPYTLSESWGGTIETFVDVGEGFNPIDRVVHAFCAVDDNWKIITDTYPYHYIVTKRHTGRVMFVHEYNAIFGRRDTHFVPSITVTDEEVRRFPPLSDMLASNTHFDVAYISFVKRSNKNKVISKVFSLETAHLRLVLSSRDVDRNILAESSGFIQDHLDACVATTI